MSSKFESTEYHYKQYHILKLLNAFRIVADLQQLNDCNKLPEHYTW